MENKLNHFDQKGNAVMVDVSGKIPTSRTAVAKGKIRVCQAVMDAVKQGTVKKGDVLGVARVAVRCGDGGAYWCECGTFDNL